MSGELTACIDGREYPYSLGIDDGSYCFSVDGQSYRFRQWTWGEKNRVTDAATTTDPDSGRLRVNVARFNELMLTTCLRRAEALETVTPAALRALNPVLGDTLLSIAYWVNELPDTAKKASPPPYTAVASPTPT
jgi:hypothetical protein